MGIYNVGGPDWDANLKKGCDAFGDGWCQYFTAFKGGVGGGDGQTFSVQDQMHWDFNFIQNRFQEWAPNYTTGEVIAPLIPIESIDKVPISMIASTRDQICPYPTAEHMRDVIPAVQSFTTMEDRDHFYYAYASDQTFMDAVIKSLETPGAPAVETEFLN